MFHTIIDISVPNTNLLTNVWIHFFHLINSKYVHNMCNVHVCSYIHVYVSASVNLASYNIEVTHDTIKQLEKQLSFYKHVAK